MEVKFPRTITFGRLSQQEILQRLEKAGIQHNEYARILFSSPDFIISKPQQAEIAVSSVNQLGLKNGGTSSEIFTAALKLGLRLCPPDLAAHFRLQYLQQPEGPYLTVASAKMREDEEYPNGFYLRRLNNILWLRGYRATSDYIWDPSSEFAFMIDL